MERQYKYSYSEGRWFYMDKDGEYKNYYRNAYPSDNSHHSWDEGYYNSCSEEEFNKA